MGSFDDEHPRTSHKQSCIKSKLTIFLLVIIIVNIITICYLAGPSPFNFHLSEYPPRLPLWHSEALLQELNTSQTQLTATEFELIELRQQLESTNLALAAILSELGHLHESSPDHTNELLMSSDDWDTDVFSEIKLVLGPHNLPLGYATNIGSDKIYPSLGASCHQFLDDLGQYMMYQIGGECPGDDVFAQQLMLKGCEPLPRRRCHPKSPIGYVEPTPYPESLWATPPDASIVWDPYTCKNYQCLIDRKDSEMFKDCKDCFDLKGREKHRWISNSEGLDFGIDEVLGAKPPGTIRIGFDIGGGSGTFAARMREHGATIVTSTMNFDGPFNSFIASRGLIPLHLSVSHRLPFFENTLDIVHSMHVLSNWIPDIVLEFALYDIYRVLRPGGIFWLDHFFCLGTQLNATYVPMFDRIGFNKLRWIAGRKLDRGFKMDEWYLSALLEKPMT